MLGAAFCVLLPSWGGLRLQQSSAPSLHLPLANFSLLQIRMGGGPRTFPGGVTKWQWKKMQQKKGKQMLKARLLRERQLYEMRKRAELKAAMAATNELEKPWEKTAPTLFSVTADEQLQTMADRFVKPGALDLWTENDGPHHFLRSPDGKPSVRVFPKDVLHSTRPYARVFHSSTDSGDARSARSETSGAMSARSETSSEQATEYHFPARERNAYLNSAQRDFNRISTPNRVGYRSQDGKFRGNFQYSEKSERYELGKGNEDSISRPGRGNFRYFEKSERYKLGKGNGGSVSKPGRGNFQYSKKSERYKLGKGNKGSISKPGRGNFQYSEKSESYKLGKGNEGSISRAGIGVKGSRVSLKKGGVRIQRLYPHGADYSSRKSNGYLQMHGVQSFAGFELAKGSWQKGRNGHSSNEGDYDYDNVDHGSGQI